MKLQNKWFIGAMLGAAVCLVSTSCVDEIKFGNSFLDKAPGGNATIDRRIFTQLVGQLIKEGQKDKALAALDYAEKMIPAINVPYDWANGAFQMAESYYQLGQNEKANKIIDELANKSLEYMIWYLSLNDNQLAIAGENFVYNASLLDAEVRLMEKYKSEELAKHYSTQLDQLYNEYVTRMKGK